MKKMNQKKRGEVCGAPGPRYQPGILRNRGDAYWAMRAGVRRTVVGGSLVELERKLAAL
jgi:hypothetical protein